MIKVTKQHDTGTKTIMCTKGTQLKTQKNLHRYSHQSLGKECPSHTLENSPLKRILVKLNSHTYQNEMRLISLIFLLSFSVFCIVNWPFPLSTKTSQLRAHHWQYKDLGQGKGRPSRRLLASLLPPSSLPPSLSPTSCIPPVSCTPPTSCIPPAS